jgi:hypothetical protein
MANKNGTGWQGSRHGRDILDIVPDAAAMQLSAPFTRAMSPKTERLGLTAAGAAGVLSEANINASIGDPDAFIAGVR